MNLRVDIDHDWTGRALEPDTPCASLELSVDADGLLVSFTAPLHGDALPAAPPCSCVDGLWEFEVLELFVAAPPPPGDAAAPPTPYAEIEWGPGGH